MKIVFVVLFFGLFFVHSYAEIGPIEIQFDSRIGPPQARSILGGILEILGKLIQQGIDALNDLRIKTAELIGGLFQEIQVAINQANQSIAQYIKDVQNAIENLVQNQVSPCFANVTESVNAIFVETNRNVQACRNQSIDRVGEIKEVIDGHIEKIEEKLRVIQNLTEACVKQGNIFQQISCGFSIVSRKYKTSLKQCLSVGNSGIL